MCTYSINAFADRGPGIVDDHFLAPEVPEVSKDVVLVVHNIGSVMVRTVSMHRLLARYYRSN